MCGISGAFSQHGIELSVFQRATDAMSYRGPDASGYFQNETKTVALGHRRLSILDLSSVANQPMHSDCGRYTMVYNGEVYNYNQLRLKLPKASWKTHSDTEVILKLYEQFGVDCFSWLNGMFAIAIWDKEKEQIVIARDQMGIKPLFYYQLDNEFVFASELKVIVQYLKQKKVKLIIEQNAIPQFFHVGFIPEPYTIYQHVFKFPSAHYATFDTNKKLLTKQCYWSAENHFLTHTISDAKTAREQYEKILFSAVEDQMISDVPLGTFLSGGIDSSLVTAVASNVASKPIESFSIGFREKKYDETQYASAVANHLKTNHHVFTVQADDVLDLVPTLLNVYDEPYADSSAFPTMLVSKLARTKVTVALSGDGGDEFFQGYGMYTWANRLNQPLIQFFRKPLFHLTQLMNEKYKRGGLLFNYDNRNHLHAHIFSQEQYFFSEHELTKLLKVKAFQLDDLNEMPSLKQGNPAEKQAYWDINHYLKDDLLVKVDRASMQYSLETRVPLLDQRIVEFALNLDYKLKINDAIGTKYLMKKLLFDLVPKSLFDRPKKGFAIPLKEWLKGPLSYLIEDYLSQDVVQHYGIVEIEVVQQLLKRFHSGDSFLYNRIWLLVVLHWWLKENEQ